jgi:Fe-S oxidoreductase
VHLFEYLLGCLRTQERDVVRLNLEVAYQRPCASRYSGDQDPLLDEIFERIGVRRVPRRYDREHALCCGGPLLARGDKERALQIGTRNVEDAIAHGARYLAFLCPMCRQTLKRVCAQQGLPQVGISDLCRMALGENVYGQAPAPGGGRISRSSSE